MEYQEKEKLKLKDLQKETTKAFKKVNCPACEAAISAANMNIHDKIAKCSNCDALFPLTEEIASFATKDIAKQEVIRPAGIDIIHFQDEIDFAIDQPASGDIVGGLFFAFLGLIATLIYFKKGISIFIPGTLWLGCAYYLYHSLVGRKKKIYINIDQNNMTIKWRPKQMVKDRTFDVKDIDQVYVKTHGPSHYTLHLILNEIEGQKHVPLISYHYTSLAKARYLEQEIEKHLGIKDRKVPESNVDV